MILELIKNALISRFFVYITLIKKLLYLNLSEKAVLETLIINNFLTEEYKQKIDLFWNVNLWKSIHWD